MLDKLTGTWAPRPSSGPHKLRECLPLVVFLRNRLKYALTGKEVKSILMQRLIKVDGKVRTDSTFPAGFMGIFTWWLGWDGLLIYPRLLIYPLEKMSSPSKRREKTSA